jgi:hypothetical protein
MLVIDPDPRGVMTNHRDLHVSIARSCSALDSASAQHSAVPGKPKNFFESKAKSLTEQNLWLIHPVSLNMIFFLIPP